MLRMAAIKLMAAVFHAFDRPIYQRLVPRHLADLLCFPPQVLHHLQKGAISVRLTKSNGRAVALDKATDMYEKDDGDVCEWREYSSWIWITVYTTAFGFSG